MCLLFGRIPASSVPRGTVRTLKPKNLKKLKTFKNLKNLKFLPALVRSDELLMGGVYDGSKLLEL